MHLDLLNLPPNSLCRLCYFLNNAYLLRMRQVSKSVRDKVDISTLRYRKTIVKYFKTRPAIYLYCTSRILFSLWKNCFACVMKQFDNFDFDFEINYPSQNLTIAMSLDNLQTFFECVNPLVGQVEFVNVSLDTDSSTVYSTFFARHCVKRVNIEPSIFENTDIATPITFIRGLSPTLAVCNLQHLTRQAHEFLLTLGETVENITILLKTSRSGVIADFTSLAHTLLGGSCKRVDLSDNCPLISRADVEKLIQIFHHFERKITLGASFPSRSMSADQIGAFKVEVLNFDRGPGHIKIFHVEND